MTKHDDSSASTGDKRAADTASEQSHSKKKVKKVVVGKKHDEDEEVDQLDDDDFEKKGEEKSGEAKQQKLVVEGDEDENEAEKGDKRDAKDDDGKGASKDENGGDGESKHENGESSEGKDGDAGGKGNAQVGELPPHGDELSKEDAKRKHGTLELGHVYFLYRPKVEIEEPHSLDDVSKFHLLLVPHRSKTHRLLAIGKKALPAHGESSRPIWGQVLEVGEDMKALKKSLGSYTYETKTLGNRYQPGSRCAASGAYVLHATENPPENSSNDSAVWHTHFAYEIAVPHDIGEVQESLHIEREGVFTLQVKNPEAPSTNPAVPTQSPDKHPQFPESLSSLFKTKFIPADPPALLDYPGAELLLVPSKHMVKQDIGDDAGKELDKEEKDLEKEIDEQDNGNEAHKALKEVGLDDLMDGKALEGHWE